MLDKIYYKDECEVILIFTHREPVGLHSSSGEVLQLLDEFLAPLDNECVTLSEYNRRVKVGEEDTQVIDIDKVA